MSLEIQNQYDKIYRYCYFKLKNKQIAEDLTQEAFLRYFSQNTYIDRGKQLAYLYTIAKNLCNDFYKKRKEFDVLDDGTTGESPFTKLENVIALRQAVEILPHDIQELILLKYANDLSMSEISAVTGLSRFAVHRKINGAIKKLKAILKEEDFN